MRRMSVSAAALILVMSGPSFAQEWIQYQSRTDFFGVNFPGEPKVQDSRTTPPDMGRDGDFRRRHLRAADDRRSRASKGT